MTGTKELTKLIQQENWQLAEMQLKHHPEQAKSWSVRPGFFEGIKESEVLPIHEACALHPPVSFIDAMGYAYPKCFRLKESAYRRMPIHIACRAGCDVKVISTILKYHINGAATDDSLGRLPIHYALSNGAAEDVIFALIKACPGSARAYDRRGWLPIHVACSVGAGTEIIKSLLEEHPASAVLETNKGSTPAKLIESATASNRDEVLSMLKAAEVKWKEEHVQARRPTSARILV
uniref:Ankyrin n=1 Tax=Helicotheca tamesis TaxID=374047 RepID=A0A7S2IIZ4_9STRA